MDHGRVPQRVPSFAKGLKVLHLSSSNLGLLFTSMGAGSVVAAVFIIPWLRGSLSSDCLAGLANLLLALAYAFIGVELRKEVTVDQGRNRPIYQSGYANIEPYPD
jgi:hypothetical protein